MFSSEVLEILKTTFLQSSSGQLLLTVLLKYFWSSSTILLQQWYFFWRTSIKELLIQSSQFVIYQFFCYSKMYKILLLLWIDETCTWNGTPWGSWDDCQVNDGAICGNGFQFREKEYCLCGDNDVQRDSDVCGISPTHVKSCYKLCAGNCYYHCHVQISYRYLHSSWL